MSGGDLVTAEQFATARAGKLFSRLDAGVGSLVEPECVRPAQTCKLCLPMLGGIQYLKKEPTHVTFRGVDIGDHTHKWQVRVTIASFP